MSPTNEMVVLVDQNDLEIGLMEKLEAHQKGLLHRAFSVLIFNEKGEMLIQKRAHSKYHSGGLWSNACCSHPRPEESLEMAAFRRLQEEINLSASCSPIFSFVYKVELDNQLIEHELDHVLIGYSESAGSINPEEVQDLKFVSVEYLRMDMILHPNNYTEWFKIILLKHFYQLKEHLDAQQNLVHESR